MHIFSKNEISDIVNFLKDVGDEVMKIYDNFDCNRDLEYKSDNSPLTLADKVASELICDFLSKKYSSFSILCEESSNENLKLTREFFVVDPIDGTKEFIKKNGEFTINIGFVCDNKSVAGFIYAPAKREMYYAVLGQGSFFLKSVGEFGLENFSRISVSDKVNDLIMVDSKSHQDPKNAALYLRNKDKIKEIVSVGSSLKGCMVARGVADAYYRFGLTSKWDICAMQIICEEAGAVFKQMDDSEMVYELNQVDYLNKKGFYVVNNKYSRLI